MPHALQGETTEIRHAGHTVEIYYQGQRIASHARSYVRGKHTTNPSHMAKEHQEHLEWTPSRMVRWGERIGPYTVQLVQSDLRRPSTP